MGVARESELVPLVHHSDGSGSHLNRENRSTIVCFFDGSTACELLLEGTAVVRVPDSVIPSLLNGFPHGFSDLSQEGAMKLLEALSAFARTDDSVAGCSVEVRQNLSIGAHGRRSVRKSLVV